MYVCCTHLWTSFAHVYLSVAECASWLSCCFGFGCCCWPLTLPLRSRNELAGGRTSFASTHIAAFTLLTLYACWWLVCLSASLTDNSVSSFQTVLLPGNALAATGGGGDLQDHCLRLLLPNVVALSNVSILCECSLYSLTFIFSFLFIDLRLCSPFFFLFSLFSFFFFTTACQWACFVAAAAAIIVWFASNLTELTTDNTVADFSRSLWGRTCTAVAAAAAAVQRWKILFTNHPFSLLICDVCAVLWEHSR